MGLNLPLGWIPSVVGWDIQGISNSSPRARLWVGLFGRGTQITALKAVLSMDQKG